MNKTSYISSVSLPVSEKIPTSAYFGISLPLAVILATPEARDWYYENFINIYTEPKGNICFKDFSFGMMARYSSIFEYTVSTEKDTENKSIVERVKYELREKHNYAYLYVDEYYISCKNAYKKYNFHHQALIYGYDDESKCFSAIAFDLSGHFAKLKYPYDETEKGYTAAFECDEGDKNDTYGVIFFKLRKDFSHHLFLPNVVATLQEYVNSTIPKGMCHVQHNMPQAEFHQDIDSIYGINTIKKVCQILEDTDILNIEFADFRRIHFLYEHAEMLLERLKYYRCFSDMDDVSYEAALIEYEDVVSQYQNARMLFLKLQVLQQGDKNMIDYGCRIIKSIQKLYAKTYVQEKNILMRVLKCMGVWSAVVAPTKSALSYDITDKLSNRVEITENNKQCIFTFDKSEPVNVLAFCAYEDVQLYFDGTKYDSYCFSGLPSSGTVELKINRWLKEVSFSFSANCRVEPEDLRLRAFGGNVFLNSKPNASSVWKGDDQTLNDNMNSCTKALIDDPRVFWRAAVQKQNYDGTDWFSLELITPSRINCIQISELTYSPRLKKYTILYTDENGLERKLLTNITDSSCRYVHHFPTVTAYSIKILFTECLCDAQDYSEPILNFIEGYYTD